MMSNFSRLLKYWVVCRKWSIPRSDSSSRAVWSVFTLFAYPWANNRHLPFCLCKNYTIWTTISTSLANKYSCSIRFFYEYSGLKDLKHTTSWQLNYGLCLFSETTYIVIFCCIKQCFRLLLNFLLQRLNNILLLKIV